MSRSSARIVLVVTMASLAVFLLWPVLQILKGGFVDADGRLTFACLGELLRNPVYLDGLENSFLLALATTALALLIAVPLAFGQRPLPYPGKNLLGLPGARSDDPAAVRRRDRHQADLRPIRRAQRPAHRTCACGRPAGRSTGLPPASSGASCSSRHSASTRSSI